MAKEDHVTPLVDLVTPGPNGMSFVDWKTACQTHLGRPIGNRLFNAVRKSGKVEIGKDSQSGLLLIRKVVS